jgi:hypothetical protein
MIQMIHVMEGVMIRAGICRRSPNLSSKGILQMKGISAATNPKKRGYKLPNNATGEKHPTQ